MKTIVLASSSITRKSLLQRLAVEFECLSPDIDESPLAHEDNQQLVMRLAQQKAQAVAAQIDGQLFIGSDQVAVCDDQVLGKPGTVENAHQQLSMCSGKTVTFLTSLHLYNKQSKSQHNYIDTTEVVFRDLTSAEIERYVATEMPLNCAGSFMSEGLGITLFSAIRNQDPTALMGLPLIKLCEFLREEGIALP